MEQPLDQKKDNIVFQSKHMIEFYDRKIHGLLNTFDISNEVVFDDEVYYVHTDAVYERILELLEAKIKILPYVKYNTFKALKKEIIKDLLLIMFKLEKNHTR